MNTEWLEQNIENCPLCKGTGSVEVKVAAGYRIDVCQCALAASFQNKLVSARIPLKYRDWDLKKVSKPFRRKNKKPIEAVTHYIKNIPSNLQHAVGLWVSAPAGLSKNAFLCYVLREALSLNKKACYIKATSLLNKKLDSWKDPEAKKIVQQIISFSNIVALADIEKVNLTNNVTDFKVFSFYDVLSEIDENRVSILVSSNMPKGNILKKMPIFMQQRLKPLREIVLRYP